MKKERNKETRVMSNPFIELTVEYECTRLTWKLNRTLSFRIGKMSIKSRKNIITKERFSSGLRNGSNFFFSLRMYDTYIPNQKFDSFIISVVYDVTKI